MGMIARLYNRGSYDFLKYNVPIIKEYKDCSQLNESLM